MPLNQIIILLLLLDLFLFLWVLGSHLNETIGRVQRWYLYAGTPDNPDIWQMSWSGTYSGVGVWNILKAPVPQQQERGREQPSRCDRCYGCSGSVWLLKTHRLSHCLVWDRRPEPKHSRAGEHCVPFVWKMLPDDTATEFPAPSAASFGSLSENSSEIGVRFKGFSDRTRHLFLTPTVYSELESNLNKLLILVIVN